jgi:hypothetical protein
VKTGAAEKYKIGTSFFGSEMMASAHERGLNEVQELRKHALRNPRFGPNCSPGGVSNLAAEDRPEA